MNSQEMSRAHVTGGQPPFYVEYLQRPEPGPGEVLLEVQYTGICGSDLRIASGDWPELPERTQGHEIAAVVIAGPAASVGKRVVVVPDIACGECVYCAQGLITQCLAPVTVGGTYDGGFAEYLTYPEKALVEIPAGLGFKSAVLAEPLSCVLYALEKAGSSIRSGGRCLVFGAGPIGCTFAYVLEREHGMEVDVVETRDDRRSYLEERLKGRVIHPRDVSPDYYPFIIDTTGFLWNSAVIATAPGGTILSFGLSERPAEALQSAFTRKELSAVGSMHGGTSLQAAVDMLGRGIITQDDLVTNVFPLEQINDAFEAARETGGMKVLISPRERS